MALGFKELITITTTYPHMDENFSPRVKDVISFSKEEALRLGHEVIGTEHLMLGLLREGEGSAVKMLERLSVDLKSFRNKLENLSAPNYGNPPAAQKKNLPLTKQAEKALKTTFLEAKLFQSPIIRTAHLLLCILRNEEDPVARLLKHYNIDYERIKKNSKAIIKAMNLVSAQKPNHRLETKTMMILKNAKAAAELLTPVHEPIANPKLRF